MTISGALGSENLRTGKYYLHKIEIYLLGTFKIYQLFHCRKKGLNYVHDRVTFLTNTTRATLSKRLIYKL